MSVGHLAGIKRNASFRLTAFLLILILPFPAFAYNYPLSPTAIREAYFLGLRTDDKKIEFFAPYTHRLPFPKTGPHVAAISVVTPYAQIVERAGTYMNYSAQDAAQDFADKPGEFRVRIEIRLTPTYSGLVPTESGVPRPRGVDFWKDFKLKLIQNGKEIGQQSIRRETVLRAHDGGIVGVIVVTDYKCNEVASVPTSVQVLAPDGQIVETTFDLETLR